MHGSPSISSSNVALQERQLNPFVFPSRSKDSSPRAPLRARESMKRQRVSCPASSWFFRKDSMPPSTSASPGSVTPSPSFAAFLHDDLAQENATDHARHTLEIKVGLCVWPTKLKPLPSANLTGLRDTRRTPAERQRPYAFKQPFRNLSGS